MNEAMAAGAIPSARAPQPRTASSPPRARSPSINSVAHSRPAACLRAPAVFVSSDVRTGGAYVPPFADVIRWERISLHLAPSQVTPHLMRILGALPDETIRAMQEGVRDAWARYLRPERLAATFYDVLRTRTSFRSAPYDALGSAMGREWSHDLDRTGGLDAWAFQWLRKNATSKARE